MPAATIPMPGDLAELIGPAAQHVENRSLLLDKFVFHKEWGLHEIKANDAHRWSLLRIAEGGDREIARESKKRKDEADKFARKNQNPDKQAKLRIEAALADDLAKTAKPPQDLATLRANHTRRFLGLFRSAYGDRAAITIGQLEGRLAINLADSLIQNAGICLDRLFGLPYIPGSAVKGVTRHTALEELRAATPAERPALLKAFLAIFGHTKDDLKDLSDPSHPSEASDQKGAIAFLPAYPVNEARIVVDLTNVHYPDYYRTGREGDQKNERPQPNPFPAVERGAQFAFCLVLNGLNNDPALLAQAQRWLEKALTLRGLGAKTAAGYGWFSIQEDALKSLIAEEERAAEAARQKAEVQAAAARAAEEEAARKASLTPEAAAAEDLLKLNDEAFAAFARQLADKDEVQQRAFLTLLTSNKDKRERWKTWKKKKPDLASSIQAIGTKLNVTLP